MLEKPTRIENRSLLDEYHSMRCLACNRIGGVVAHHIKSKKSGGDDVRENLMPLCQRHHREVHDRGLKEFSIKYLGVKNFLLSNGWEFDKFKNRWTRY